MDNGRHDAAAQPPVVPHTDWLERFWLVLGGLAFLVHFIYLGSFLVNVPYADEWTDLNPWRDFQPQLTMRWIFSTQNSHPRVLHNLVTWVLYALGGKNYIVHALINFLFLAAGSVGIVALLRRALDVPAAAVLPFLASTLQRENMYWANQAMFFHFTVFSFLGYYFAVERPVLSFLLVLPACFASGAGSIAALGYALLVVIIGLVHRRQLALRGSIAGATLGLVIAWWALVERDNPFAPTAAPWMYVYWRFVTSVIGDGFGVDGPNALAGLVVLIALVALLPVGVWIAWRRRGADRDYMLVVAWWAVTLVGCVALLGITRSHFSPEGRVSRYTSYSTMLVPALWGVLCYVLSRISTVTITIRRLVLCGAWMVLAYSFVDNFDWRRAYAPMIHERRNLYECVRAHYRGEGPGQCYGGPPPNDTEWMFRRARELDFNFYREMTWR